MSNKLTIQIYGTRYSLTTTEDVDYVRQLGQEMDKMVSEMMKQPGMSINQALILLALSYLDANKKSEEAADNLRRQITDYADSEAKIQAELAQAKRKLEKKHNNGSNKGQGSNS